MKSKLFLVLSVLFFIATIFNSLEIVKYGTSNLSLRFIISYISNLILIFSSFLLYKHYKKADE